MARNQWRLIKTTEKKLPLGDCDCVEIQPYVLPTIIIQHLYKHFVPSVNRYVDIVIMK